MKITIAKVKPAAVPVPEYDATSATPPDPALAEGAEGADAAASPPVTLTPDMKAVLGLEDCVVGDEYDLTVKVTAVNKDGSVQATVEHDEPAPEEAAPPEAGAGAPMPSPIAAVSGAAA